MTDTATSPARLCVFDLDGTLADTAPDLVAALNHVLVDEGLPMADFDQARGYVGHGARVLIERAHAAHDIELDEDKVSELVDQFVGYYAQNIADGTVLFEHVLDAMDEMADNGWRFAICTNKQEGLSRILLDALDVTERFDAICGGDTFAERKPNGQHILKTIEAADGDPKRTVMIGDSPPDVLAAKDADVPVIAVSFGYSQEPIGALDPDIIIDTFMDLPGKADELVPA
ncbi:MAG: phosphoglycolate phosphatase [Devosiaceae bacterium]